MDIILEAIGWTGSLLIVWSLMVARVLRFRWMNLWGAVIATGYNAAIEVWPFAFMNFAIAVIDIYWLRRLYREAHDDAHYRVLPVPEEDPFVRELIRVHHDDIAAHAPDFDPSPVHDGTRHQFLIVRGDEAVGVVAVRDQGSGVGLIELDWVKQRFRDFTPGEFVYRESQALVDAGFQRLELVAHQATDERYLQRVGFHQDEHRWVREVVSA
jgi:hypothetical protein